ncbi:MAG: MaoC family dehydratase [bacterium]
MAENEIILPFRRRPNALLSIALALYGISTDFKSSEQVPKIRAVWEDVKTDPAHLRDFGEVCGLPSHGEFLYPLYPMTFVYPLVLRVLGHKKAPLSVFRMLNTKLQVTSHRRIGVREPLRIISETGALRVVPKGLALDLTSAVQANHETVWESLQTFYYRGKFGEGNPSHSDQPDLPVLSRPETVASWYLPDGIGFRFARISGDANGIHYSSLYARLHGFKRDFAQPLLILSKSLSCFSDFDPSRFRLLALFKGPVYYKSNVSLKGISSGEGIRFDIYCEDNLRPSLSCQLSKALLL